MAGLYCGLALLLGAAATSLVVYDRRLPPGARPLLWAGAGLTGVGLVARADDTPEAVQGRLRDYHDKIRPVLELFEAKEVIVAVDATGPVAQVQAAIHDQLGLETSSA